MTGAELWLSVLKELRSKLSQPSFDTWFKDTVGIEVNNNVLFVETNNQFCKEWIEQRYFSDIEQILEKITDEQVRVQLFLKEDPAVTKKEREYTEIERIQIELDFLRSRIDHLESVVADLHIKNE